MSGSEQATVATIQDVEFGSELPPFVPDTSIANSKQFGQHVGWDGGRFTDHEVARSEGFPGAIIPGVLSQGFLGAMINRWAPEGQILTIDTIFRAPVLVDQPHSIKGTVTDVDEDECTVEIDITVTNEKEETRVLGTAVVRLPSA